MLVGNGDAGLCLSLLQQKQAELEYWMQRQSEAETDRLLGDAEREIWLREIRRRIDEAKADVKRLQERRHDSLMAHPKKPHVKYARRRSLRKP